MLGNQHAIKRGITTLLLSLPLSAKQATQGYWEPPFDHKGTPITIPDDPATIWPAVPNVDAYGAPTGHGTPIAVHLSLIPVGPDRGKVMMMDHFHYAFGVSVRNHRYAIVDPKLPSFPLHPAKFKNYTIQFPNGEGDLFCSGHAWMPDGTLMVAGGSKEHFR